MAFRLSASGPGPPSEGSRSSGGMLGKMKDRAAAATAAGMAAASTAASKAAKTAKYGVSVARDAAGLSSSSGSGAGRPANTGAAPPTGGYMPHEEEDDDEEMELQRALAASMKTAKQEERSRVAEAPPARTAPPAPKALPGLDMLMEMGFDESLAKIALQACEGDVEAALAQLCADRDDLEASDGSTPVGTPTHAGATQEARRGREAVLEAAEKRRAEAKFNAGTMDDWRQEQRRQAARSEPTSRAPSKPEAPEPAAPAEAPAPARETTVAAETEELMLQQALAASMGSPNKEEASKQGDPDLVDLQLRQAMPDDELDLQMALSASLHAEKQDPSCAGAAVGEEQEQEEERARLSAAAQQRLATEEQCKKPSEEQETAPPA